MDLTRRLRAGSLLNLVGAAVTAITSLLLVVVTARVLPADDAGHVFAATSVFLIAAAVLKGGTATGVVLFIARGEADDQAVRRIARLGLVPVAALSSITVVVGLVVAPQWWMLVVALPAGAVLDTLLAVSRGRHQMGPTVAVDRIGRPLLQVALTGLAVLHPTIGTVAAAWALPYPLACVAAVVTTPCLLGPFQAADTALRRDFARFATARGVATTIQVCFARLDIVLVAALAGPAQAAVYTAATRFVAMCQLTQQAFATAAEPALAGALAHGDERAALELYRTVTVWLTALVWPGLAVTALLARQWLRLFGDDYAAAHGVILVLACAMAAAIAVGMVETILNMAGRSAALVANNVAALAVMIALDLALIPHLGALGAAIGWAAAIVAKNALGLWQMRGSLRGSPVSVGWLLATGASLALLVVLPTAVAAVAGRPGLFAGLAAGLVLLSAVYVLTRSRLHLDELLGRPAPSYGETSAVG